MRPNNTLSYAFDRPDDSGPSASHILLIPLILAKFGYWQDIKNLPSITPTPQFGEYKLIKPLDHL